MRFADSVGWLPHEMRPTIYLDIKNYTKGVMQREWQLMKDGQQIGHEALSSIQAINKRLQAYKAREQMQLLTKQVNH
ncbi:MAG TPA: hypothetical protein LFW11_03655 [Rickettsia endosymbiont of Proechinophthirus fluctus]|nr:hypothetical protein [Rickettsia endosymbiont of Proechinophthirus fluctus]HJD54440.1 hypothetical protein [Rickettsia endosymbiont of Proechinophthirus fluctus]